MDMGFDHDAWPLDQGPGGESDAVCGRLDWHGLRARFLAARACRQASGGGKIPRQTAVGACFDRSTAQALADFDDALHGINLTRSADGKTPLGNDEDVASASMRGDRG
jgi:hypothetical protein